MMLTLMATLPDFLDQHMCTLKRTQSLTTSVWVMQSTQHLFEMSIDNTTETTDTSALSQDAYVLGILWSFRSLSLWFPFVTATSKQRWYCAVFSYWITRIHRSETQFSHFYIYILGMFSSQPESSSY